MYSCPPDNKQKLQNSWEDCVRSSFMTRMERYNAEKSDVSLRHNQFWNEESWHSPHLFHAECWIASRSDFLFRSSCRGSKNGRKQEGVRSQEEETREPRSIPDVLRAATSSIFIYHIYVAGFCSNHVQELHVCHCPQVRGHMTRTPYVRAMKWNNQSHFLWHYSVFLCTERKAWWKQTASFFD